MIVYDTSVTPNTCNILFGKGFSAVFLEASGIRRRNNPSLGRKCFVEHYAEEGGVYQTRNLMIGDACYCFDFIVPPRVLAVATM